jgi:hypothetical protein
MEQNLVGYLLNALDADTHQQVEVWLRSHPEGQQQLETLRQALAPLEADRVDIAPPTGLAFRTLARVAEYRCRPKPALPDTPAGGRGGAPVRRWLRRVDLLVAAAVVVVAGGLLLEGALQFRSAHSRVDCANNLRNFHQSLTSFSQTHDGDFPGVPVARHYPEQFPDGRGNVAGIFVPELVQAGCLSKDSSIRCPANGSKVNPNLTLDQLRRLSREDYEKAAGKLSGCYAYSLGFNDPTDTHCNLRRDPDNPELSTDLLPIMADRPTVLADGGRANTPNHRSGQNVLYVGGNVRFASTPKAGINDDDIYVNKEGKVKRGINRWDTVLGSSADQP